MHAKNLNKKHKISPALRGSCAGLETSSETAKHTILNTGNKRKPACLLVAYAKRWIPSKLALAGAATSIIFVATKVLSRQTRLSRQKWYLRQLPPVIVNMPKFDSEAFWLRHLRQKTSGPVPAMALANASELVSPRTGFGSEANRIRPIYWVNSLLTAVFVRVCMSVCKLKQFLKPST